MYYRNDSVVQSVPMLPNRHVLWVSGVKRGEGEWETSREDMVKLGKFFRTYTASLKTRSKTWFTVNHVE